MNGPITADVLAPLLRKHRISWEVHAYGSISSTNDAARRLAEGGAQEGTLVIAETQTAGHGRRGNVWASPPGGLWFSFVLRPHLDPRRASGMSVVAAVATARTVIEECEVAARIKWPNDVFVEGRKLAGAMVTSAPDGTLVVGIGLNANVARADLPELGWYEATSLQIETGEAVDRKRILATLLLEFERRYFAYRSPDHGDLLDEWRRLSLVLGEEVVVTAGEETVRGTVFGLEDDGGIVLRLSDGRQQKVLPSGEVTLALCG